MYHPGLLPPTCPLNSTQTTAKLKVTRTIKGPVHHLQFPLQVPANLLQITQRPPIIICSTAWCSAYSPGSSSGWKSAGGHPACDNRPRQSQSKCAVATILRPIVVEFSRYRTHSNIYSDEFPYFLFFFLHQTFSQKHLKSPCCQLVLSYALLPVQLPSLECVSYVLLLNSDGPPAEWPFKLSLDDLRHWMMAIDGNCVNCLNVGVPQ